MANFCEKYVKYYFDREDPSENVAKNPINKNAAATYAECDAAVENAFPAKVLTSAGIWLISEPADLTSGFA